ncbi:HAMP domain-containing histidine kinase [Nocardioides KLBMP 9356]|uniref:histidine kinase n=1 Tax=Nocardioides potassii TaxID=2911371 RepID=A0ABS9H845_9ACTN|nr:HAMP domain-containing sensor histidine kinase [Nocardioides potassii]MCF6376193.1 HAMP domain-containing histidine kinase [Nocardioides potassii]
MSEDSALQTSVAAGPVSATAAALAAEVVDEDLALEEALQRTVDHLLAEPRVQTVTAVLTSFTPDDPSRWIQLGGRAWVREWTPPGSTRTLLPPPGAGPEAALTMPWLSQRGRESRMVVLTDRALLPPEAAEDRDQLEREGVGSFVATSFRSRGGMFGSMSLSCDEAGAWPAQLLDDFRLLTAAITSRLTLEQARRALAEALDASAEAQLGYQQLFGAVGHELRTPVTAVLGYTEGLIDDAEHGTPDDVVSGVLRDGPRIVRASEQLLAIVDSLLGAGRTLAGDDGRTQVGVADAVADVVHWHLSPAATGSVEMTVDIDPAVTVWAHASAVRQILTNLVGNAINHHRAAGGTVHISADRLVGESGHPMVRIVVRDDGPGLDAEQLSRAFEPFVRFAADGRKGTGLGLTISRTMAERDGGAVQGESVPGTGSTFWLELPADPLASVPSSTD